MSETNGTNQKFGMTSWGDVNLQPNNTRNTRDSFLRLDQGDNLVRVITKPFEYLVHRFKANESDPGYGTKVMSSIFHGSDPLMEPPYNLKAPKKRWYVGVIDRKTQSYKVLDISPAVFKSIQELYRDSEDWGDPSQYDINIKVNKSGGAMGYFTVIPKSKKALTPSDLEIKQTVDLEFLRKLTTPPTQAEVLAKVKLLVDRRNQQMGQANSNESKSVVDMEVENDDQFEFPSVQ